MSSPNGVRNREFYRFGHATFQVSDNHINPWEMSESRGLVVFRNGVNNMGYANIHYAAKDSMAAADLTLQIVLWCVLITICLVLAVIIVPTVLIVLFVRWRRSVKAKRQSKPLGSGSGQQREAPSATRTNAAVVSASKLQAVSGTATVPIFVGHPLPGETQGEFSARLIAEAKARGFVFYTQR